jgi:predicted O-methyltransferase YrrM
MPAHVDDRVGGYRTSRKERVGTDCFQSRTAKGDSMEWKSRIRRLRALFGSSASLENHWTKKASKFDFRSGLGDSAWLLYGICRSLKPAVAVEVGSARGKSACYIGMALKENGAGRLFAVDPHISTNWNDTDSVDTYQILRHHLEELGLTEVATIVRRASGDALADVPESIDMLFIDGDHCYEGVKADWNLFTPRLSRFGLVVFHDTMWDLMRDSKLYRSDMGVPRFVEELRQQGHPVVTIDHDFGVSIVQPIIGGIQLSGLQSLG